MRAAADDYQRTVHARALYINAIVKVYHAILWVFVFSSMTALVTFFLRRGVMASLDKDESLSTEYYYWLILPTCVVTFFCVSVFVRLWLTAMAAVRGSRIRLARWFHPIAALVDWLIVSIPFALLYILVFSWLTQGPEFALRGQTIEGWWSTRAYILAAVGASIVFVADRTKLLTPGTAIPKGNWGVFAVMLYAAAVPLAYNGIGGILHSLADQNGVMRAGDNARVVFSIASGLTLGSFFGCVGVFIYLRHLAKIMPTPPMPYRANIGVVGPTQFGKTLLFVQAYHSLRALTGSHRVRLHPVPGRTTAYLDDALSMMGRTPPEMPSGSVSWVAFDFELHKSMECLVTYTWNDLPGGAFTDPAGRFKAQYEQFMSRLETTDGLLLVISAFEDHLAQYGSLTHIYLNAIESYLAGNAERGRFATAQPIAIVITQSYRARNRRALAWRHAAELKREAEAIARDCRLLNAPCRIFESDAILNADLDNLPKGGDLSSKNCGEPIIWIASQVARANLSGMDLASGATPGSMTKAARTVAVLEEIGDGA